MDDILETVEGFYSFLERDISVQTHYTKINYTLRRARLCFLQDLPGHKSDRFIPLLVAFEAANKLHSNLQITIEELYSISNLAFVDLNVNGDSGKKVAKGWYEKHTATGTILNFRGCAPLQNKTKSY